MATLTEQTPSDRQKQQTTLDRIIVEELRRGLEEVQAQIKEFSERVARLKTNLGVSETGLSLIYSALEAAGIMKNGEPVQEKEPTRPVKPKPSQPTKDLTALPVDAEKINWTSKEGAKGPFELSDDFGNPEHKKLLAFLKEHAGGSIVSNGQYYWVFTLDAATIGRKPSNRIVRNRR